MFQQALTQGPYHPGRVQAVQTALDSTAETAIGADNAHSQRRSILAVIQAQTDYALGLQIQQRADFREDLG